MSKLNKFAATLMIGTCLAAPTMAQEVSFNASVTSNYIWRGMTQTNDNPAFQAGADLGFENGFYVGTWASNVDFGDDTTYELDLYGGYAGEAGGFSYDIGYISYIYDDESGADLDFSEVYASIGTAGVTFSVAYQVDNDGDDTLNNVYYNLGYETEIGEYTVGVAAGIYDLDGGDEQNDYALTIAKDAFTLAITDTDISGADPEVSLSYGIEF